MFYIYIHTDIATFIDDAHAHVWAYISSTHDKNAHGLAQTPADMCYTHARAGI